MCHCVGPCVSLCKHLSPSIFSRDSCTYLRVFSSTAHGIRYPTFTLELAGQAQVSRVVLFLRQGSCGLRNMLGTGCGGINVNTNYNGQDQGFIVTVGNSPCQPETPCPGTVCQWVRRMTSNQQFVIPPLFVKRCRVRVNVYCPLHLATPPTPSGVLV
jgi:hypothetical protein